MYEGGINYRRRALNYRKVLICIIAIIIVILLIFLAVVKVKENKRIKLEQEEQARIAAEEQRLKEEEEARIAAEEEVKRKEEEEAANATGVIYLTFDDGPSPITHQILDILDKKEIKATFFLLNFGSQYEDVVKRENDSGHTLGLHGYSHEYSEVYQSAETCMNNFKRIQERVYEVTGVKSNIIRFPGGSSNTISRKYCQGVMTQVTQMALDEGFRYFDWNVGSDDSGKAKTTDEVYNNVIKELKAGRNNVVLMHDFSGNKKTLNALEKIIDYGLNNGYIFRNITDNTPMVIHKVNN